MDVATLKERLEERLNNFGETFTRAQLLKPASGTRFVLFIGDEGAILVHMKDNTVLNRQFVSDASEQNLAELRQSLAGDPKARMLLVIDTMDQTFVQQTLPPISQFSLPKMIRRRLDRDFTAEDIKGYVLLGREEGGRRDWNFIMVSIQRSAQISRWLDFIGESPNRFQGIYLVSAEAELIVKRLKQAAAEGPRTSASEWTFFVSHNKVGGFRQVILRNGRIIFTRMAQPVGESTPEVIAGNIEQEMLSTIEYLRRLSFTAEDGLDVYIVASSAIKEVLDTSKFGARSLHILTPYELAQQLDIEGATQQTDQFGDVVLAAAIGASRKHILKLSTPQTQKIDTLYQISLYQRLAAAAISIALVAYAGSVAYDMYDSYSNKLILEQQQVVEQRKLQGLKQQNTDRHLDLEATSDLVDLYQELQHQTMSPLPFIARVEDVVKPPIVVKGISWSLENSNSTTTPPDMQAVLTLEFPGITSVDAFHVISRKILGDVKKTFSDYKVAFTNLPPGYAESDKLEMTFNNTAVPPPTSRSGPLQVDLTIEGKVITTMPTGK